MVVQVILVCSLQQMQKQLVNCRQFQWLPLPVVENLLFQTSKQYKAGTYDINLIVRQTVEWLKPTIISQSQSQASDNLANLSKQIIFFCSLLGGAPRYFIELLNEQIITSQSHIITLNSKNDDIIIRLFKDYRLFSKDNQHFPAYEFNQTIRKELYYFLNIVSKRISKLYQNCTEELQNQIKDLTDKVKKSKIMNNFLLYKIFREIAENSRRMVEERSTESAFRFCQKEVIQQFARYIINKFQVIRLFSNLDLTCNMFEPSSSVFMRNLENNQYIQLLLYVAINSQGKFGVFVKTYSQNKEQQSSLEDYLLVLNQNQKMKVINCKNLRKKWYVIGTVTGAGKMSEVGKEYLVMGQERVNKEREHKKDTIQQIFSGQPIDSYTNTNGVVGRCLYLMRRYSGVADFFKDISKRAILTRSIQQIMMKLPIVGYMILAGTFSANFYRIFSNRFSTDQRKLKELGGFMLNTGTTVGTSILGAIAGQVLIPIPFFGAMLGTVIGGYLGDKGGKSINSWIQKKKFKQTIVYLKSQQKQGKYWLCSKQFYKHLQIKQDYFYNYVPKHMKDYVFATLICFVMVCFHESKRLNDYNKAKLNSMKTNQDQAEPTNKGAGRQKQFEEQVLRMNIDDNFETEFNTSATITFLQQNYANVYEHYEVLQKSILSFLSKII